MALERGSQQAFLGVSTLLFVASAALTIVRCTSMSAMGEMSMPGGWTMSMMWMRMPGQTWPGVTASFLTMWVVMMVAMMLPSLAPVLWQYCHTVGNARKSYAGWLTALVGMGYLFVWTLFGAAVFLLGVARSATLMQEPVLARAVPISVGAMVLLVGAFQLSQWNASRLALCWDARDSGRSLRSDVVAAWRHGVRLGLQCGRCCAGLMTVLLVVGMMDLRAMTVVTAAITAERLAPAGMRVAQIVGVGVVGVGLLLIVRAIGVA
jgi:predicted metal-binding membrane protein